MSVDESVTTLAGEAISVAGGSLKRTEPVWSSRWRAGFDAEGISVSRLVIESPRLN